MKIINQYNSRQAPRYDSGQAMIVATMFFLVVSITVIFGLAGPVIKQQSIVSDLTRSRQSYFLAEAGVENIMYKLKTGKTVGATETLTLNGETTIITTTDAAEGKEIVSNADVRGSIRKVRANIVPGTGVTFNYGVQVGAGGFELDNNAGVNGNIYSNSSVTGANGAFVTGSVVAVNSIDEVIVGTGSTGDALAPTVNDSTIRGNLYCQTGSGNNKACNTSLPNPTAQSFPITDEQIDTFKSWASDGGTFVGDKDLSGTNDMLGPLKIQGSLTLSNGAMLTITGTLWVTGNISLSNNAVIKLASGYASSEGLVIVDGTSNFSNGATFQGSGTTGSYIMLLSTSNSSSAVNLSNNVGAAIVYVPNGTVELSNNAGAKQITAKTISLSNNAVINYEQGLVNSVFTSGPNGGFDVSSREEIE